MPVPSKDRLIQPPELMKVKENGGLVDLMGEDEYMPLNKKW
jgi:hypothetical protein